MASVFSAALLSLTRTSSRSVCQACYWSHRSSFGLRTIQKNGDPIKAHSWNHSYLIFTRNVNLFGKVTADELWAGVYGVSNAGRKRGRGKNLRKKIDLNRGQIIGVGRNNIVWPGLNAPVVKGREVIGIKEMPADPDRKLKADENRGRSSSFRSFKVPALQRGWTGAKFGGVSIGPPDPMGNYKFEDFDTRVLEFKIVANMTRNLGRKQRFSSFVVTGNKKGLAGFGLAKAPNAKASLRKAKNRAAQKLHYIERYNDHTVYHNFHTKEEQTSIFVWKAAKGYGLVCHRALKTICQVIGIEDLGAKVEGSTNIQRMTKAFFKGLQNQETHQELADRIKLNVVEFRPELDDIPIVVAKPRDGETQMQGIREEAFDFENYYYGGKVPLQRPKHHPFFYNLESWRIKYKFLMKSRNQKQARLYRIAFGLEPSKKEKKLRARPLR